MPNRTVMINVHHRAVTALSTNTSSVHGGELLLVYGDNMLANLTYQVGFSRNLLCVHPLVGDSLHRHLQVDWIGRSNYYVDFPGVRHISPQVTVSAFRTDTAPSRTPTRRDSHCCCRVNRRTSEITQCAVGRSRSRGMTFENVTPIPRTSADVAEGELLSACTLHHAFHAAARALR